MLNNTYKEIIQNLEKNIGNEKDLIYAKAQVTELAMGYLEELEKIESLYKEKVALCEQRLDGLETKMHQIDAELLQEEALEEEADLEPIKCPYCNANFFIEFDNSKTEMRCPDCKNIIELDWGNFEDDM